MFLTYRSGSYEISEADGTNNTHPQVNQMNGNLLLIKTYFKDESVDSVFPGENLLTSAQLDAIKNFKAI